ncbi:MAG: ATP-grasp domain-containing protein [bacterium]
MARLHEHQGKELLAGYGVAVPTGRLLSVADPLPQDLRYPVLAKAQVWTTSRFAKGLITRIDAAADLAPALSDLFSREVSGFPVTHVLVEEALSIEKEYFFSYFIDDADAQPAYLFSPVGGSGIEEVLADQPDKVVRGSVPVVGPLYAHRVRSVLARTGAAGTELVALSRIVLAALKLGRDLEARSLEINPIVRTADGRYLAADCRMTVDDYAVFRHPELGIEIARELANPPTALDRLAYAIERDDYRGTFYFAQLAAEFSPSQRYVGFHGSGGGGSMMSMDALTAAGFRAANYCDTSGNPPASKIYRAARIIASQPGIVGYFGSGSGVASQEQVHSARGLVKAFWEMEMDLPVVMRLGGNLEREAVRILEDYTRNLPAPIRGFTKDESVAECASVLKELVGRVDTSTDAALGSNRALDAGRRPDWLTDERCYRFDAPTGRVSYHHPTCLDCPTHACVTACVPQILKVEDGKPVLAIAREEAAAGKCIECLACEVECRRHGLGGGFVELPLNITEGRPGGETPGGKAPGGTEHQS